MSVQFYKPTKTIKGTASRFSLNTKNECVFLSLIKQVGWDGKNGSFKGGAQCVTKLSVVEMGRFVAVMDKNLTESFFHTSENQTVQIKFSPYYSQQNTSDQKGFSLLVTKTNNQTKTNTSFLMGFNFGEAVALRQFFVFAMDRVFAYLHQKEKKEFEDKQKNNNSGAASSLVNKSKKSNDDEEEDVVTNAEPVEEEVMF